MPACGGRTMKPRLRREGNARRAVGLFSIGRSPAVKVFTAYRRHIKLVPARTPTSPAQRYYITTLGECPQTVREAKPVPDRNFGPARQRTGHQPSRPQGRVKEALIKSLFAFILEFLCNARNGLTRIASYLRKPMTKQCIKILIKENSMN